MKLSICATGACYEGEDRERLEERIRKAAEEDEWTRLLYQVDVEPVRPEPFTLQRPARKAG